MTNHHWFSIGIIVIGLILLVCLMWIEDEPVHANNASQPPQTALEQVETVNIVEKSGPQWMSIGLFKLTAYCGENYHHICNNGDASNTATMTKPKAGRTIAVDPDRIPYGSIVLINGKEYIAEDCGSAIKGNRIDIFHDSHQEALEFGIQYAEVKILVGGEV